MLVDRAAAMAGSFWLAGNRGLAGTKRRESELANEHFPVMKGANTAPQDIGSGLDGSSKVEVQKPKCCGTSVDSGGLERLWCWC